MSALLPDFRSPDFLRGHIRQTMAFYDPVATDPSGGMYHFFLDVGTVYDERTRHLVSATRFVVTHALLWQLTGEEPYRERMAHAVRFLRAAFFRPRHRWVRVADRLAPGACNGAGRHTALLRHGVCHAGVCARL